MPWFPSREWRGPPKFVRLISVLLFSWRQGLKFWGFILIMYNVHFLRVSSSLCAGPLLLRHLGRLWFLFLLVYGCHHWWCRWIRSWASRYDKAVLRADYLSMSFIYEWWNHELASLHNCNYNWALHETCYYSLICFNQSNDLESPLSGIIILLHQIIRWYPHWM